MSSLRLRLANLGIAGALALAFALSNSAGSLAASGAAVKAGG